MNMNLNMINVDQSRLVPIIAVTFILSFDSLFRFIVLQQRAINLRHSIFQDPSTWICQRANRMVQTTGVTCIQIILWFSSWVSFTTEGITKRTKKLLKDIEDWSLQWQSPLPHGLWFFGMFGLQQRPCGGGDSIVRHKPWSEIVILNQSDKYSYLHGDK